MAVKEIFFEVTPENLNGYWIAVGDKDVPLDNDQGSISLETGKTHILTWWMEGTDFGVGKMGIVGKDEEDNKVVEVGETKVPPNDTSGAGYKRFHLE